MGDQAAAGSRTCTFVADGLRFVVESSDQQVVALVERLFGDLEAPGSTGDDAVVRFQVFSDSSGGWTLHGPRVGRQTAPDLRSALTVLLAAVNVTALDVSPDRLHLHAAAAVRGGGAVVMAAKRSTGKTTTVAHLTARPGWAFITDETVSLSEEDGLVRGTPRPLSVKPHGRPRLDHLLRHWMLPEPVVQDAHQFVPLGAAGVPIVASAPPSLVVLLQRPSVASSPSVSELHPADAVVALMQETLDAARFGSRAVDVLARLAVSARCVELALGDPEATAELIESLADREPRPAGVITAFETGPRVPPGVRSVSVDGRAVVHSSASGAVLALDEAGTRIWGQVASLRSGRSPDGPGVSQFLERLAALDVLRQP